MTSEEEKELNKVTEERDAARRHASRLKGMLAGAYSLLAMHGVDLGKDDERISEKNIR